MVMEQGTGVEPASEAWEAPIIADILTLRLSPIIAERCGKFKSYLSKTLSNSFPVWYNSRDSIKEAMAMAQYEMVQEIKNMCRNNQMRDVFFREVECDDPEAYVRGLLRGKVLELTREGGSDGSVTIHVVVDGLMEKFVFTPF